MSAQTKTIAFFGASTGVGLAALKLSLATGHQCLVLLRKPSKFDPIFPPSSRPANLIIKEGNAHDENAVAACLSSPSDQSRLVDAIMFSIGAAPNWKGGIDDPDVCKKGIACLLSALKSLRQRGAAGDPFLVALSTMGHSRFGRDVALPMVPVYAAFVKVPGADKQVMEDRIIASGEKNWVVIRPSHLVDGAQPQKKVRVGVEDMEKGVESREIGYLISREDVGRWCFEEFLGSSAITKEYVRKAVSVTW